MAQYDIRIYSRFRVLLSCGALLLMLLLLYYTSSAAVLQRYTRIIPCIPSIRDSYTIFRPPPRRGRVTAALCDRETTIGRRSNKSDGHKDRRVRLNKRVPHHVLWTPYDDNNNIIWSARRPTMGAPSFIYLFFVPLLLPEFKPFSNNLIEKHNAQS